MVTATQDREEEEEEENETADEKEASSQSSTLELRSESSGGDGGSGSTTSIEGEDNMNKTDGSYSGINAVGGGEDVDNETSIPEEEEKKKNRSRSSERSTAAPPPTAKLSERLTEDDTSPKKRKRRKKTKERNIGGPTTPTAPLSPKPKKKSREDAELIRLALHRNPYFTCLDEEQIENFITYSNVESFRPGHAVVLEGSPGGCDDNDNDSGGGGRSSGVSRGGGSFGSRIVPSNSMYYDSPQTTLLEDDDDNDNDDRDDTRSGPADIDDYKLSITSSSSSSYSTSRPSITRPPRRSSSSSSSSSSCLYVIRRGHADVFYAPSSVNPATLGPGTVFGEGGFLFGRQHSASVVVASDPFDCFVVDKDTFLHKILPSKNMKQLFKRYAKRTTTDDDDDDDDDDENDTDNDGEKEDHIDEYYMTMDDFMKTFQPGSDRSSTSERSDGISLSNSAKASTALTYESILRTASFSGFEGDGQQDDYQQQRVIRLGDFCLFHLLMARPDPEVDIAFMLMDRKKAGVIDREDFEAYLENLVYFDPHSEFIERYFGHGQTVRVHQFPQFLADLQQEMGRQAFLYRADQLDQHAGYLPPKEFIAVLKRMCGWKLPDGVVDRLESIYCKESIESAESTALASVRSGTLKGETPKKVAEYSRRAIQADLERRRNRLGTRYFSYVDFVAFQDVLTVLPGIYNLIERACHVKNAPISPDDFKVVNRVWGMNLSRSQVDLVFQLFDLDQDGYITAEDARGVCGDDIGGDSLKPVEGRDGLSTFAPPPNYPRITPEELDVKMESDSRPWSTGKMLNQIIQFSISTIAGGIAMAVVYPLDLVKTRMMNQRIAANGARFYATSFDCLQKVLAVEGLAGLYRGLLPPLLAVGPEKFIKFTVNDLLRGAVSKDGTTSLLMDVVCGGCAGACQLLVTNPLEITKIRMQMQGDTDRMFRDKGFKVPKGLGLNYMSFSEVFTDLGVSGLYRGAAACLMRDIPFGAIYFPAYAASLDYLKGTSTDTSASDILLSGTLAAVPAALLTTPMDFVKTRLQVVPRPGETVYEGTVDCIRKVYQTEGLSAFFKGSIPRICRIAPQFGISLLCYEKISSIVGFKGAAPPTNAPINPYDYNSAFATDSKAQQVEQLVRRMSFPSQPPRFPQQ